MNVAERCFHFIELHISNFQQIDFIKCQIDLKRCMNINFGNIPKPFKTLAIVRIESLFIMKIDSSISFGGCITGAISRWLELFWLDQKSKVSDRFST